ncbi:MAG TPA: F420-dependent NADP oxidoreductase [Mucilaginibacter sp.]|nr:F420-dependent NADP oxidoreductase [Mucilaginibacter sp.]
MRITIIGSGNVATHLAAAFKNAGHNIVQVYSRDMHNASLLAYHVRAEAADSLDKINTETDLFVIAIKDDAIEAVASELAKHGKLIVHTSGATDLAALLNHTNSAGVFYPLQTFSKTREVNFNTVPLCIEGADEEITSKLNELAYTITQNVYRINSAERKTLHLAAVFACNFPNYLYYLSQQLLAEKQLPFDLLRPLILETAEKVQEHLPADVQTGPAIRNDEKTMASHLDQLRENPDLQELYRLLSQGIIKMENRG